IVHRRGATRLWPLAPSPMTITVDFFEDYEGPVTEYVPASFVITRARPAIVGPVISGAPPLIDRTTLDDRDVLAITWNGSWKAGESAVFAYEYDAPDKSPDFFLLGPLKLGAAEIDDHPAVMELLE
ncbi:MAG: hypothetical protein AAB853_00795, partial [Patescibacteria group bacterium]